MRLIEDFATDGFMYPAERRDLMKIQGEVQKRMKAVNFEEHLNSIEKDYEKANAVLTLYGYVAYEEGYRKGLSEVSKENLKIEIKRRNRKEFVYKPEQDKVNELVGLVKARYDDLLLRHERDVYCEENNIENNNEGFMLSVMVHTFFEAGYTESTLNVREFFKNMYPEDEQRVEDMTSIFEELFGEFLKEEVQKDMKK